MTQADKETVKKLFSRGVAPDLIAMLLTTMGSETLESAYRRFSQNHDEIKDLCYGR